MKDETVAHSMPTSDMTVAEILESWPETVPVFQDFKTACVGCVMAPFDTMVDVARIYELELSEIMEALHRAVETAERIERRATN
jgi:hybrid cluster-associated redox disulfide protein